MSYLPYRLLDVYNLQFPNRMGLRQVITQWFPVEILFDPPVMCHYEWCATMRCSCALSSPALAADPRWAGDISKKLPNRWTFLDYIHYYIPIIVDLYYSVYYTHYPLSWGQRRPFLGTETCRRSFFGIALKYGHVCNKTREGQPLIEIICVQYFTFFFCAGWFFEDLWFAIPGMVPFQRHLSPPNIPLGVGLKGPPATLQSYQ